MNRASRINVNKQAILSVVGKFSGAIFGFIAVIIFSRVFSLEGFGTAYVLMASARLAISPTTGVAEALSKRISEHGEKPNEYLWAGLIFHTFYSLIVGSATIVLLFINPFNVSDLLLIGGYATFVGLGYYSICNEAYAGAGHPSGAIWSDSARSVLTFIGQVSLIVFLGGGPSSILFGEALGTVPFIFGLVAIIAPRPTRPSLESIQKLQSFAVWIIPKNFLQPLYSRFIIIMLGVLSGGAGAAIYKAAIQLTLPAMLFSSSFGTPLGIKVSADSSQNKKSGKEIRLSLSMLGIVATAIVFGTLVLGNNLMTAVYGSKFGGSGLVLFIVAIARLGSSYSNVLSSILYGSDKPKDILKLEVIRILMLAPLSVSLFLAYGVTGAVLAFAFTELVMAGYYWYITKQYSKAPNDSLPVILRQIVAGVLMSVSLYITRPLIGTAEITQVALLVAVGGIVYIVTLLLISSDIRMYAREVIDS